MTVEIDTNAPVYSMLSRSVVVHDFSGARVACSGITYTRPTPTIPLTPLKPGLNATVALVSGASGRTIGSAVLAVLAVMAGRSC